MDGPYEYEVQGDYGYGNGWETLHTEDTRERALDEKRRYDEAEPGVPHRVKKVPVEPPPE